MSLLETRNHIDCGAAAQLCNQRPQPARRRVSPCTSMPASQRLLSEDNETRSLDVPLSVPGTKPVSRSAQKPAGNLSQSLRETTRDEHEKAIRHTMPDDRTGLCLVGHNLSVRWNVRWLSIY
jgi:hypothetical protein